MAYDEKLADRIREALADLPDVKEKVMFSGVVFMVNGKMCINVSHDDIMCRIDPAEHAVLMEREYTREMLMKGKMLKGYLYVEPEGTKTKKQLDFWIDKCLAFNKIAKASKKSKKK